MISSLDEAMPFFSNWSSNRTPLDFILSSRGVGFRFSGYLLKASLEDGLVATSDESLGVLLTASLAGARSFEFVDPREAAEENRALVEAEIEFAWAIRFEDGLELALYERRFRSKLP